MTEPIDIDALEARASETAATINGFEVLSLIAELRQERERADGEAHDARHLRSVRDDLHTDLARAREAIEEAVAERDENWEARTSTTRRYRARLKQAWAELRSQRSEALDEQFTLRASLATAEIDLARAQRVIEAVRKLPRYRAEEAGGIYNAVDADDLGAIVSEYDQKEQS